MYATSGEAASLTLVLGPDDPRDPRPILEELDEIRRGLSGTGLSMWTPTISTALVQQLPLETWTAMVERARARLARGELRKVVLARRTSIPIATNLTDTTMLARLRREIPECTRFAIRRGNATFLGATPELLFSKTGSFLKTEALAGSIRCTGTDATRMAEQTARIFESDKDLKEHQFVVDQIATRIRPLATERATIPPPAARRFRNIIHLHTPITASLTPDVDPITILAALHPTPAVGGVPAVESARCIVELEPCARGWYAGPIGWLDAYGDAVFCVAIRSGLIAHPTAYVYAGAGLVAESDPLAEYSETGLKQMPMMLALGIDSVTLRATVAPHARDD